MRGCGSEDRVAGWPVSSESRETSLPSGDATSFSLLHAAGREASTSSPAIWRHDAELWTRSPRSRHGIAGDLRLPMTWLQVLALAYSRTEDNSASGGKKTSFADSST